MEVMTTHTFHDTDVKKVKRDGPDSVREIVLKACAENSMIIVTSFHPSSFPTDSQLFILSASCGAFARLRFAVHFIQRI